MSGYRIEPGEIEAALAQCSSVQAAVVTVSPDTGHNQLTAYFVAAEDEAPSADDLRHFLKQRLPEYMVPSRFVAVSAFPLSATGKVDRRALASADASGSERHSGYTPPRTEIEASIAGMFADILHCKPVSVTDSFFDLGGRSLGTASLLASIEARYGVKIHTSSLVDSQTVEQLALLIGAPQTSTGGCLVPFQRSGSNMPFFCVHGLGGSVISFRELSKFLGPEQPFYGLQAEEGGHAPHIRVEDMAAHYIKQIREVQPTGPFHIGGWSLGGLVAYEMARQLYSTGDTVALLVLLDTPAPLSIFRPGEFLICARAHVDNWRRCDSRKKLTYIVDLIKRRWEAKVLEGRYEQLAEGRIPNDHGDLLEAQTIAERNYRAKTYAGSAVLFRAMSGVETSHDPTLGWGRLITGGLEICEIPGDHITMMREPHVRILGESLRARVLRPCKVA